jgi:hypothetical protein
MRKFIFCNLCTAKNISMQKKLAIGKHAEGCKKSEKFREKKWKKSMLT